MSDTPAAPTPKAPTRPPRRWFRRLVGFLVVVLLLLGFAPNLIAWTGLIDVIARQALSDLNGRLSIGSATLGWLLPVELRDVTLSDTEGAPVATIPRVVSSKSLLALAWDRSDLGEFTVERPTLHVVTAARDSNVERVLVNYLKPSSSPASPPPVLTLRVEGATIHLRDTPTNRTTTLEQGQAVVTLPRGESPTATVSASVASEKPGRVSLDATLGTSGQAKLTTEAFPLDLLDPALRRFQPGTTVGGRLSGDAALTWGTADRQPTLTLAGNLRGQEIAVTSPTLQGDTLRLARLELPLDVTTVGPRATVRQADLRCDVASATVRGTFDTAEPVDRLLTRPDLTLDARVDLARLAALLPRTLAVRDGTLIREGQVSVKLTSRAESPATVWQGEVRTSALKAERQGKLLSWDEPLLLTFISRLKPGELPAFDQFECRSEFLVATASGSAEKLHLEATLTVDRLMTRLADFIDLAGTTLTGVGKVRLDATRTATGSLQATARVEATRFAYADAAGRSLQEAALTATLDAQGLLAVGQPVRIDSGTLALSAGGDLLSVSLREPIADLARCEQASAALSLSGDLARWRTRAAGVVPVPRNFQLGGNGTITGIVTYAPTLLRVDKLGLDVDRTVFRGYGLALDEPKVIAAAGSAVITRATGKVEVTDLQVRSSTVAMVVPKATLDPIPAGYRVTANGSLNADLGRLQQTLQIPGDRWAGLASGTLRCSTDGAITQFDTNLDVKNFAYGTRYSDPQVQVTAVGSVDPAHQVATLDTLRVGRDALVLDGKGTLSRWSTTCDVDLAGSLGYDLARLTPQFRDVLGSGFQATGQGRREFRVTGPLTALRAVNANASLDWQSVRAYGLDVGPGELRLNLSNGILTTNAIEAGFAGGSGKARVQPTVRLDPAPMEATLAPGTIINRAKLTPQSTAHALGYALPAIANSTATEGEFSFILEGNRIPLSAPTQTSLQGRLIIHRAVVAAGPLTTEIARLLGVGQTSVTLANENVIPVRVENGRVHHENLTLTVNNFTVKTRGSVGLDGSLSLVAEVPIPAALVGSNPKVAQALAGRMIPVPIGGTMTHPRLDPAAFQQAVAKLAGEVARDTIRETGRDLIEKQLEKVLPPAEKGLNKLLPFQKGLERLLPGRP